MKKIKILIFVVLAAFFACSCEDNSGAYVEQLYTNDQKANVFTACLTSSLDSAFAHLCVHDGFYQYNNAAYRIDFSNLPASVFDTLNHYQLGYLADSLILCTNRMAESCNASVLGDMFEEAIKNMTYYEPDSLLYGGSTSITDYFVQFKATELKNAMQSPVSIRMNLFRVNEFWNQIMNSYYNYSSTPVNVDLQGYIIDKMLDGIFEEMRIEEYNIRMDSTHQSGADTLFSVINVL